MVLFLFLPFCIFAFARAFLRFCLFVLLSRALHFAAFTFFFRAVYVLFAFLRLRFCILWHFGILAVVAFATPFFCVYFIFITTRTRGNHSRRRAHTPRVPLPARIRPAPYFSFTLFCVSFARAHMVTRARILRYARARRVLRAFCNAGYLPRPSSRVHGNFILPRAPHHPLLSRLYYNAHFYLCIAFYCARAHCWLVTDIVPLCYMPPFYCVVYLFHARRFAFVAFLHLRGRS